MKSMGRHKQYNREDKLKQAMRIFWERGYHNVSLNELINELKMGKRTFYEEFVSKDELYFQALMLYSGMGNETMLGFIKNGKNIKNLRAAMNAILDITTYDKNVHSCLMSNTAIELANINDKYRGIVAYHMSRMAEEFKSIYENAIQNGEIRDGIDSYNLATLTNIIFSGSGILARGGIDVKDIKNSFDLFFDLISMNSN